MKIFDAHEDIAANIQLVTNKDFFKKNPLFGESISDQFLAVNQSDLPRLIGGDVQLVFAVIFARNMDEAKGQYEIYENIIKQSDGKVFWVKTKEDLRNVWEGKVGFLLHMEWANPLSSIEDFDYFYKLWLRSIGVSWRDENAFFNKNGLTSLGIQLIEKLNTLPVICDLAHTSEELFWDILQYYKKSPIVSHTAIREICDNNRNLSIKQIDEVVKRWGIIGIIAINLMVGGNHLRDMVQHFHFMKECGYIDNVCIGSDFDGMVNPALTPLENFSHTGEFPLLIDELKLFGFHDYEIQKIAYRNLERFLGKIL